LSLDGFLSGADIEETTVNFLSSFSLREIAKIFFRQKKSFYLRYFSGFLVFSKICKTGKGPAGARF